MTSFADVALIRDMQSRLELLEKTVAGLIEERGEKNELVGLRLQVGRLQAQVNALKGRSIAPDGPMTVDAA